MRELIEVMVTLKGEQEPSDNVAIERLIGEVVNEALAGYGLSASTRLWLRGVAQS